jgi:4-diphosphocytidyl-2-C-methyl-D-erythritol kinase
MFSGYNRRLMQVQVRSFAKINLGLCIGARRANGFHDLCTIYQTIALHDLISVDVSRGSGIEIRCEDSRVPTDESNTCYRIVERAMATLGAKGKVLIEIEKRLPVQGGLGGASSNAIATLLALEHALKKEMSGAEKLRIAAETGSDLPLFLVGGTVLGVGRGEEVYPLPDLPPSFCVLATPEIGVSTPQAFSEWDVMAETRASLRLGSADASTVLAREELELRSFARFDPAQGRRPRAFGQTSSEVGEAFDPPHVDSSILTVTGYSDRMIEFSRKLSAWLSGLPSKSGTPVTGVPASGRGRAESPLLDLVRTGIENDFEQVVFPKHPELRQVKSVLEKAGAFYASLSGSGSALYGLFRTRDASQKAAARLRKQGIPAQATLSLDRRQYWRKIFDC